MMYLIICISVLISN